MGEQQQGLPADTVVIRYGGGGQIRVKVRDGVVLMPKGFEKTEPRRSGQPRVSTALKLRGIKETAAYGPDAITQRLIAALGNNALAALLGVNQDRPNRWASGRDTPTEENRQQLADLDSLVGQLFTAFTPTQARLWMEGHNAHLNARPIDVYRIDGAGPVIEAIRAHQQGAFA
ncbi:hypothetical protein [Paenarthrobacter sp. PH39-S1]|uniref:hypothetical protein n=1 Tax=Paenarthrobacter sp. PH39-S1 TaxID=3046204 RepID=UPI0024B98BFD|nr:hypothetical protein [Paenarthrobacter sp. PH39-S1]MDJ0355728.1 hypothetical protein [Paenarthrobacter sp. PH39-S1]